MPVGVAMDVYSNDHYARGTVPNEPYSNICLSGTLFYKNNTAREKKSE